MLTMCIGKRQPLTHTVQESHCMTSLLHGGAGGIGDGGVGGLHNNNNNHHTADPPDAATLEVHVHLVKAYELRGCSFEVTHVI